MKTARAIIATALARWIEKPSDPNSPCKSVKLVREVEGAAPRRIDAWATPKGANIAALAQEIEDLARSDVQNAGSAAAGPGGICEVYGIIPYFGHELAEGAYTRFRVTAVTDDGEEGAAGGMGQFAEGANPRGQIHMGMRHIEAMARVWLEGISRAMSVLESQVERLSASGERMALQLTQQRTELEEARDRGLERQLTVYRIHEEEKRSTKLMEGLLGAAPGLLNLALGKPILPENTKDQSISMLKNWIGSLTVEQMEEFQKTLDPQQYMPFMLMKQQVEAEKEAEEKKRQAQANKETGAATSDPSAIDAMARRDAAGVPREPLV